MTANAMLGAIARSLTRTSHTHAYEQRERERERERERRMVILTSMFFLLMSQANDERFLCHIPAYKAVSEEDAIKLVSAMEKILVKYISNNMKNFLV
jgi:hypothetical protein